MYTNESCKYVLVFFRDLNPPMHCVTVITNLNIQIEIVGAYYILLRLGIPNLDILDLN